MAFRRDLSNRSVRDPPPSDIHRMNKAFEESDENARPIYRGPAAISPDPSKKFMSPTIASPSKKKILAERNDQDFFSITPDTSFNANQVSGNHNASVPRSSSHSAPYDPVTNYLSPRPQFLRYNPNRHEELLVRMEGVLRNEQGSGAEDTPPSPETTEEFQEIMDGGTGSDDDDAQGEPWYCSLVCKLLLLLGVLVSSTCYISSMNSVSTPASQDYKVFGPNLLMTRGLLPSLPGNLTMSPQVTLESQVHSPNTSLVSNLRGSVHREGAIDVDPITIDVVKLHDEVSNSHLEDLFIGYESIRNDLFVSDELTGEVGLEEKKSLDGVELAAERDGDTVVVNGTLDGENIVVEEKDEEVLDSHEEQYSQRNVSPDEGSEEENTVRTEIMETQNDALVDYEDSQAQYGAKEKEGMGSAQVSEMSQFPQFHTAQSTPSDDETRESSLWVLYGFIPVTAILVLLHILSKSLSKSSQRSRPVIIPCSEPEHEEEEESHPAVSVNEYIENNVGKSMPLNHSTVEHLELHASMGSDHNLEMRRLENLRSSIPFSLVNEDAKQLYASRPPSVELLGEFVVVEKTVFGTASAQKPEGKGAEESQFSQSERRKSSRKSNLSSSAGKVYPTSSAEFLSIGSSTPKEKPLKKEDIGKGELATIVPTTPLRRSSRLRSKATS